MTGCRLRNTQDPLRAWVIVVHNQFFLALPVDLLHRHLHCATPGIHCIQIPIPVYTSAGDLRKCAGKMHFDLIQAVCYVVSSACFLKAHSVIESLRAGIVFKDP